MTRHRDGPVLSADDSEASPGRRSGERTVAPFLQATAVAPVVPVRDVQLALARFERLGFLTAEYRETGDEEPIYGYACFGPGEFHVACVEGLDPATTTSALYLYVEDADAVFEAWSDAGVEGRFHPPVDTPYGLREMAYVDPDGNLMRVGSPLDGAS